MKPIPDKDKWTPDTMHIHDLNVCARLAGPTAQANTYLGLEPEARGAFSDDGLLSNAGIAGFVGSLGAAVSPLANRLLGGVLFRGPNGWPQRRCGLSAGPGRSHQAFADALRHAQLAM